MKLPPRSKNTPFFGQNNRVSYFPNHYSKDIEMWSISVYSPVLCFLFFFFFFSFFFLLATSSKNLPTITQFSTDIINQTCYRCASYSPVLSYNFCTSSLQAVPIGHVTNLQGLAVVSMELALENARNTISSIEKMLSNESFTPYEFACLEDCLELYSDGIETLIDSAGELLTGHYNSASVKVSAVMEDSTTCEDGFSETGRGASPLTVENYYLFQLSDVALCIIRLLSLPADHS